MSRLYDEFLAEHKENVRKGFNWIQVDSVDIRYLPIQSTRISFCSAVSFIVMPPLV